MATVIGWGLVNPDLHLSSTVLNKLNVPILPLEKCRAVATDKVTERNLCAGTLNKWKDAAPGDSGGNKSYSWQLVDFFYR